MGDWLAELRNLMEAEADMLELERARRATAALLPFDRGTAVTLAAERRRLHGEWRAARVRLETLWRAVGASRASGTKSGGTTR